MQLKKIQLVQIKFLTEIRESINAIL